MPGPVALASVLAGLHSFWPTPDSHFLQAVANLLGFFARYLKLKVYFVYQ